MIKSITITIIITVITFIFPSVALAASLSLSPSSGTFNKSCNFSLDILLDTGGAQTDGTDAILKYDTARVSATSVTKGTIYEDYPGTSIDDANGQVAISGLASVSTPFSSKGTLATVQFVVKDAAQTGATQITFDFDPNDKAKTTDSNVVERGTIADVLSSVVNGSYTIGSGTSCIAASPSPTPRPAGAPGFGGATPSGAVQPPQPTPQPTLPPGGTAELTYTLTIVGVVLTILGIFGLALL